MTFEQVLPSLKSGVKVSCVGWSETSFIFVSDGEILYSDDNIAYDTYIDECGDDISCIRWSQACNSDYVLRDGWYILED